ncbi:hypothetical protein CI610_00967 [invertebrate metagenome]|uniref:Uncharacterized protein n=1 Tax=invertebrate metagenome TaxID=1711999 RepID=A0A2H9TAB8_9ZZZZ
MSIKKTGDHHPIQPMTDPVKGTKKSDKKKTSDSASSGKSGITTSPATKKVKPYSKHALDTHETHIDHRQIKKQHKSTDTAKKKKQPSSSSSLEPHSSDTKTNRSKIPVATGQKPINKQKKEPATPSKKSAVSPSKIPVARKQSHKSDNKAQAQQVVSNPAPAKTHQTEANLSTAGMIKDYELMEETAEQIAQQIKRHTQKAEAVVSDLKELEEDVINSLKKQASSSLTELTHCMTDIQEIHKDIRQDLQNIEEDLQHMQQRFRQNRPDFTTQEACQDYEKVLDNMDKLAREPLQSTERAIGKIINHCKACVLDKAPNTVLAPIEAKLDQFYDDNPGNDLNLMAHELLTELKTTINQCPPVLKSAILEKKADQTRGIIEQWLISQTSEDEDDEDTLLMAVTSFSDKLKKARQTADTAAIEKKGNHRQTQSLDTLLHCLLEGELSLTLSEHKDLQRIIQQYEKTLFKNYCTLSKQGNARPFTSADYLKKKIDRAISHHTKWIPEKHSLQEQHYALKRILHIVQEARSIKEFNRPDHQWFRKMINQRELQLMQQFHSLSS